MDNSPLRKLSPELRNTIAEMALYHEDGVNIAGEHTSIHASAFAQTCKELRQDYAGLYYSINTFKYTPHSLGFKSYGNAIGDTNVEALGSIILVLIIPANMEAGGIVSAIQELDTGGNESSPPAPKLVVAELRLKLGMHDGSCCREYSILPNALQGSSGSLRAAFVSLSDELNLRLTYSQIRPSVIDVTASKQALHYLSETLGLGYLCAKLEKAVK